MLFEEKENTNMMTEEMKYWRRMLNRPIEYYAEGNATEHEKLVVKETYDEMFKRLMEKEKTLDFYEKEYRSLQKQKELLANQNAQYKNYTEWIVAHCIDQRAFQKGKELLDEMNKVYN